MPLDVASTSSGKRIRLGRDGRAVVRFGAEFDTPGWVVHRDRRMVVHAVVRTYAGAGASELFDLLEARRSEVEALMRPIDGFVSYLLARNAGGGTTVTVCRDKAGCDDSVARARDWRRRWTRRPRSRPCG